MPMFRVYGTVTASCYLGEFEAASAEEAVQIALDSDAAQISVCHQCADQIGDPEVSEATAVLVE